MYHKKTNVNLLTVESSKCIQLKNGLRILKMIAYITY